MTITDKKCNKCDHIKACGKLPIAIDYDSDYCKQHKELTIPEKIEEIDEIKNGGTYELNVVPHTSDFTPKPGDKWELIYDGFERFNIWLNKKAGYHESFRKNVNPNDRHNDMIEETEEIDEEEE